MAISKCYSFQLCLSDVSSTQRNIDYILWIEHAIPKENIWRPAFLNRFIEVMVSDAHILIIGGRKHKSPENILTYE